MLATLQIQDYAPMIFKLYPDRAPITVANFITLANSGFYDGLAICRIVCGYVIQGGSPDNDIMTDSDFHIPGEFAQNGHDTGMDHRRGALSMARSWSITVASISAAGTLGTGQVPAPCFRTIWLT